MNYRKLGRSPLQVSRIGLGCATFGREIDQEMAFRVMDRAIFRGINFLDTAEAYSKGLSEEVVGNWIEAREAAIKSCWRPRWRVVLHGNVCSHLVMQVFVGSRQII